MNDPTSSAAYWKEYFSHLSADQGLSDTAKLDFSNDRVRFQTYGWMMEAMGPLAGRRCLDAGCGTGDLALVMNTLGAGVDAFDFAEPGIARLRRAHPQVRWVVADLTALEGAELAAEYDVVTASEVLQHVPAAAAIRTLWQRVAPGGRLVAVMPNADCPIVQRTQTRFGGHYNGMHLTTLLECLAALPGAAFYRWRGAGFLADQTLLPYGLTPWLDGPHDFGEAPPNRFQFAVLRAPQ